MGLYHGNIEAEAYRAVWLCLHIVFIQAMSISDMFSHSTTGESKRPRRTSFRGEASGRVGFEPGDTPDLSVRAKCIIVVY